MSVCSVDGCAGTYEAKGLCGKHYLRMWKNGTLDARPKAADGEGGPRPDGYIERRVGGVRKLEHVLVAEAALGKTLPAGAEVHHVDEDRSNNSPTNLVICPDKKYHKLLHVRMRARDACGNPSWLKCNRCHTYDDPQRMYVAPDGVSAHHRACVNRQQRAAKAHTKGK